MAAQPGGDRLDGKGLFGDLPNGPGPKWGLLGGGGLQKKFLLIHFMKFALLTSLDKIYK